MKKLLKITAILIVLTFAVLQFFRPDHTNPPIVMADSLQAPADVHAVLSRSCNDCHSNNTVYPWYSNVSPFSWFLADHIEHGRSELNFSIWNTYSPDKKLRKLEEICEQVESGFMPLPSYLWIHRDAALNEDEAKMLCDWTAAEIQK